MINYLGYKFLLFCKVSTQPRRSIARWACSRETEQPGPQQPLTMVAEPERERGGVRLAGDGGRRQGPQGRREAGEGRQSAGRRGSCPGVPLGA